MRSLPILLLLLALAWPVATLAQSDESDRGYIQGLLEDALSGPGRMVRLDGFAGALSSRATIDKITVSDPDGIWLTMDDVAMVWTRSALLSGVVEIDEITVDTLALPRLPVSEDALPAAEARGSLTLPDLPVSLQLRKLDLKKVILGAALFGDAAELSVTGSASLAGGSGATDISVQRRDKGGRFDFEAAFDKTADRLSLRLDLEEPERGIAATLLDLPGAPSLALNVAGEGPLDDFDAKLTLDTDGRDRLAGQITLTGQPDKGTGFSANIGGDIAPVLAPQYRDFLGSDIRLSARGARAGDGAIRLDALTLNAAALRLSGQAALTAEGWPASFQLDGDITPPTGTRVTLPVPGVALSMAGARLRARYDAAAGEDWDLSLSARDAARGADNVAELSLSGTGTISRERQEVRGSIGFDADGLALSDAALARATGSALTGGFVFDWWQGQAVFLRDLALTGADYGLTGRVEIDTPDTGIDLVIKPDVSLRAGDLSRFDHLAGLALGGSARLDIDGEISPVAGELDLSLAGQTRDLSTGIARLDPLLAGPGEVSLSVVRDAAGLRAGPALIRTDHARIDATADLKTGASRVQSTLRLPDLSAVLAGVDGPASADITAVQTAQVWTLSARAQLPGTSDIRFDGQVEGDGTRKLIASGDLKASVGRLARYSRLLGQPLSGAASFMAEGSGDLLARTFDLAASGATSNLSLGAPGLSALLRGRMLFNANATRGADGVTRIETVSLDGPNLQATLGGQLGANQGNLAYRVSIPDLGLIVPELPGAARLTGTARHSGSRWRVDTTGTGPGGISARVNGTIAAQGPRLDLSVSGSAPLALANPRLPGQSLSGAATIDLSVNGPPALSSVSGTIRTAQARLSLPAYGIVIEPITGDVTLTGERANVALRARLSSGGRIEISGPVSLAPPYNADLTGRLDDATLREADLFEADLDAVLNLRGALAGGGRIGGDIVLTTVELRIPKLGPSYAALDGLRHEDLPPDVRQTLDFANLLGASHSGGTGTARPYPLNLRISAPGRLFVRGRGLDAELGGGLTLRGTTADIVPQGQFDLIRGRLDLLGRRLNLTEGALWLRGTFDPVIRFAATTQVDDVTVMLRIEGEASAPELTVSATPDLPQDEALSLLLFGRDPSQISALQAIQLAAAIRTLSGRGALGLGESLRQNLGVSDLDIGTDAEGNTQARVGKYISDRVYSDVTVNSEGNNQIRLNFDVSPSVTLRGRVNSDGETGLGVFFERDY